MLPPNQIAPALAFGDGGGGHAPTRHGHSGFRRHHSVSSLAPPTVHELFLLSCDCLSKGSFCCVRGIPTRRVYSLLELAVAFFQVAAAPAAAAALLEHATAESRKLYAQMTNVNGEV